MSPKTGLLLFSLLLSISSCVSYKKLTIEIVKPAGYSIPPEIKKLTIVSRNLKYESDTLQNYLAKNNRLIKDKIRFNPDSLARKTCIDSLTVNLLKQNRFDSILIYPINYFPLIRVKIVGPNKADWYKIITQKTKADGLVILDMFSCFYTNHESEGSDAGANVVTSNIWTFYDTKKQKITDRFVQIDTLYWDGRDESGLKKARIPAKKEAITLSSGVIGRNYSKHLLPSWTMVYRDIMDCKKADLKNAARLALKSNWEAASDIWKKYTDVRNKRNQIVALYNLALASEMNGDVDRAIELTDRAAKISSGVLWSLENENIRKYSAVLYQRKTELKKLSSQYELP
jgi:hypothetical protein